MYLPLQQNSASRQKRSEQESWVAYVQSSLGRLERTIFSPPATYTAMVVGDSHITTFDGRPYTLPGKENSLALDLHVALVVNPIDLARIITLSKMDKQSSLQSCQLTRSYRRHGYYDKDHVVSYEIICFSISHGKMYLSPRKRHSRASVLRPPIQKWC